MQPNIIAPPPWTLRGNAFIMIYHFPREFCRKHGFLDAYQKSSLKGWIGAVMMVDYTESPVGPYRELLFIPGIFRLRGRLTFSVSKIYVSTYDSVWNGQTNWGIPKEQADFTFREHADGSCTFEAGMGQKVFFHARLQAGGFGFPVSSNVLPFFRLSQQFNNTNFRMRPRVRGRAQISFVRNITSSAEYFPPVHQLNPLAVLHLKNFKMKFPQARTSAIKNSGDK